MKGGVGVDKQRGAGRVCKGKGMAWSNEVEKKEQGKYRG